MSAGSGVTIVIPTFNRAGVVREAIASALQCDPTPAEVIVVDCGSTDATQDVVRPFGDAIRYVTGSYPNAAAARNAGAALVRTQFIGFLDSDDVMRAEKLTCLVPLLGANDRAVVAIGRTAFIDEDGDPLPEFNRRLGRAYDVSERLGSSYAGQAARSTAYTSATLLRRTSFEEIGGYDETLPSMEDWDLYLRMSLMGDVLLTRCIAADYRVWEGNVGSDRSARGTLAVARKHLAHPPDLSRHELSVARCSLNLRAALSLQTLGDRAAARRALVAAAGARPERAVVTPTFWRLLAASSLPRVSVQNRRERQPRAEMKLRSRHNRGPGSP
jgi:hypothetical protein